MSAADPRKPDLLRRIETIETRLDQLEAPTFPPTAEVSPRNVVYSTAITDGTWHHANLVWMVPPAMHQYSTAQFHFKVFSLTSGGGTIRLRLRDENSVTSLGTTYLESSALSGGTYSTIYGNFYLTDGPDDINAAPRVYGISVKRQGGSGDTYALGEQSGLVLLDDDPDDDANGNGPSTTVPLICPAGW